ncbi:hypothetical protein NDU88_006906 [Pleurodeles waltl]|uniref:Uncharacterized protein n=1 Tax=Pleurodeles waltl TaxID=8319 RepID=A0AAV7N0L9_PLEWA|nr:hypothetical protein NDU88_006906 [Pleurodeles waltl]
MHEERSSSLLLGQSAGKQKMRVGVRAPSVNRLEEMVRSRATRLTSGKPSGPELHARHQQLVFEEPSTSHCAEFVMQNYGLEDEVLDYQDEEELEEGKLVQQRVVKKGF